MIFELEEKKILDLYQKKNFDELTKEFLKKIEIIFSINYKSNQKIINNFALLFLEILLKNDFLIPKDYRVKYILNNRKIGILIQNSKFRNSDRLLSKLLLQINLEKKSKVNILTKVLTLYSNQNSIEIDYKKLLDIDQELTIFWYFNYIENFSIFNTKNKYDQTKRHLERFKDVEDKMSYISPNCTHIYFKSSYFEDNNDQIIKNKINLTLKKQINLNKIYINPKKEKIAIITAKWQKGHPVYRSQFTYLKEVSKEYELTLVNLNKTGVSGKTDLFQKIINIELEENNSINLNELIENNFSIAYYPDLGFNFSGIFLSNIRIAPIQISSYGHPVSSFGSEIDFWLGGESLEEMTQENYSERLLLTKGSALYPETPDYNYKEVNKNNNKEFIITLPWSPQKINYPDLLIIKEIIRKSKIKVKLIIFTLFNKSGIEYFSLKNELIKTLKTRDIELINYCEYSKYMEILNYSDLVINASFGGYTITIDTLCAKTIFITKKEDKISSLLSPLILKNLDLKELISNNKIELIEKILYIIENPKYKAKLENKIQKKGIITLLRKKESKDSFKKIFDQLLK